MQTHLAHQHLSPADLGALAARADLGGLVVTHFSGWDPRRPEHFAYLTTLSAVYPGPFEIADDMDAWSHEEGKDMLRSFPVVERDHIVGFWPGDPARAEDTPVPDFSAIGIDGHAPITGVMPMAANYEYGTDNLLDLAHIEFVHKGTFAGRGVIFAGTQEVKPPGDQLHSNWWMPAIPAPAHTFGIYDPAMITDHWLDMRWEAPASMYLQVGACPQGGERAESVIAHQAHILTPETQSSSHDFRASTRQGPPSPEGDAMLAGLRGAAFGEEGKPIIEAAYANTDGADFWDRKPLSLGIDTYEAKVHDPAPQVMDQWGIGTGGPQTMPKAAPYAHLFTPAEI